MLQPLASLRRRQEKTHRADAADGTRPDGVLPTNRLRSTEPSGCASRTVRLPSDLRHGNARNGAPLRLPHPLRFFCRVCIYRYVFATRQARLKHSPCRSTTANSDYILVSRYRHEMTNGAPRAGSANPPAPAIVGANRPPVRDTARRPVSFLSRSLHKTYLAEIRVSNIFSRYQKMFHPNYRRRIAFRLRAQSRAMPSADIRFAAGRFSTRPIS